MTTLAAGVAGFDVSRETRDRLRLFVDVVEKWTMRINLIGPATLGEIWHRHIEDSAQLYPIAPPGFRHWADLGSGGGFPGIVIAILCAQHNPEAVCTLVESDKRKATFLRYAIRELGLSATVADNRIEALAPLDADVVSARALGPLPKLLPLLHRHLNPEGIAILPKGRTGSAEVASTRADWRYDLTEIPSKTEAEAMIFRIERIARV